MTDGATDTFGSDGATDTLLTDGATDALGSHGVTDRLSTDGATDALSTDVEKVIVRDLQSLQASPTHDVIPDVFTPRHNIKHTLGEEVKDELPPKKEARVAEGSDASEVILLSNRKMEQVPPTSVIGGEDKVMATAGNTLPVLNYGWDGIKDVLLLRKYIGGRSIPWHCKANLQLYSIPLPPSAIIGYDPNQGGA